MAKSHKIDKDAIGVEVSWSFGDGDAEAVTLPRELVRKAIVAHGFEGALIEDYSGDDALRLAAQTVKGRSREIVVQELRRPNKDTRRAVGVYQVQARPGESGDDVVCGARVRIQSNGSGERIIALAPEGQPEILPCMDVAMSMARMANSLLDNVVNRDISNALVAIGWECSWISRRRNSGGVYFMPSGAQAEQFVALLETLQAATSMLPRDKQFVPQVMEVYPKPLTMQMWAHSARDQYDAQVKDLEDELAKLEQDGTMRVSTMEKRAIACDRLIEQAETHRLFLASHVEVLTSELKRIRERFNAKLAGAAGALKEVFAELDQQDAKRKRAPRAKPAAKAKETEAPLSFLPPEGRELTAEELFDV